jgi:hypothetical protein
LSIMVLLLALMLTGCAGDQLNTATPVPPASPGTDPANVMATIAI